MQAMEFLESLDADEGTGERAINGEVVFARIIETVTSFDPDGLYEAHRDYIDIHYVLKGEETIVFQNTDRMCAASVYDPLQDVRFFTNDGSVRSVRLRAGDFCILYPQEGHRPCCCAGEPSPLKKVVVKVRVPAASLELLKDAGGVLSADARSAAG